MAIRARPLTRALLTCGADLTNQCPCSFLVSPERMSEPPSSVFGAVPLTRGSWHLKGKLLPGLLSGQASMCDVFGYFNFMGKDVKPYVKRLTTKLILKTSCILYRIFSNNLQKPHFSFFPQTRQPQNWNLTAAGFPKLKVLKEKNNKKQLSNMP